MRIIEKDVVSVIKSTHESRLPWVYLSTFADMVYDKEGEWIDNAVLEMCYRDWLRVTGVKLTIRKAVRVRISAEIVPTP